MSINYNAIIGKRAKMTLPSTEGYLSTNSILRDPPKSITTRRIDRVGSDDSMNRLYANSGDRFSENINLYARGVNPFVAVQYSNTQYSGGVGASRANLGGNTIGTVKLPYRIMDGGAFRPPQLRQEQLLPLSRQARLATSMMTNRQFNDYSKTVMCQAAKKATTFRQVKKADMTINTTATANKSQNIKKGQTKEHYVNIAKHVIENTNIPSAAAKLSAKANLQIVNRENLREAKRNVNAHSVNSNRNENIHITMFPDNDYKLEKNLPEYAASTKRSDASTYVRFEPEHIQERTRNLPEYAAGTKRSDASTYVRFEPEHIQERTRNLPEYTASTKRSDASTHVRVEPEHIQERTRNLPEYAASTKRSDTSIHVRVEPEHVHEMVRNIPEYSAGTKRSDSRVYVKIEPENDYEFYQKVTGSATTNIGTLGDYDVNRDYKLPETLQYGGFANAGAEPTWNRNIEYNKRAISSH